MPVPTLNQKPIRKCWEIKGASFDENCIKGPANVMGIIDRGGDCVFPGFFSKALPAFLVDGFVSNGHDYSSFKDIPAMPMKAEEIGNQLYTEAVFHSTQAGQDARTVATERMDAGKSVGLSVGFMPNYDTGVKRFANGKELLKYARETGCDMALFDQKTIKACESPIRGLLPGGCMELYEYGIVPVPMNQRSMASDVKSADPDREQKNYWDESTYDPFEDIEQDMAISAMDSLYWALRVCIYRAVLAEETPLEDRLALLTTQFDLYRDKGLSVIEALLTEVDDVGKAAFAAELKSGAKPEPPEIDETVERIGDRIGAAVKEFTDVRAFEAWLRDEAELSNKQAVAIASAYFKQAGDVVPEPKQSDSEAVTGDSIDEVAKANRLRDLTFRHLTLRQFAARLQEENH